MSENIAESAEPLVELGKSYVTRCGAVVGPIESIDVNGWAWFKDRCWNVIGGTYYARGSSLHDIIGVIQ